MGFEEKYLDVLQNIEFPVQVVYKNHPDLTQLRHNDIKSGVKLAAKVEIASKNK
ncbi:MAG TPA: hypothetical protein VFF49_02595 [Thermodesulfobacteriota bacterium]|nr:hypothetical protein [Thermodesulfobacteriota bacterium]